MDSSQHLHIVSLPHTALRKEWSWCAYTTKVRRLAAMMTARGYDVTVYANEGVSDFPNTVGCSPEPPNAGVVYPEWTTSYFAAMNERVIAEMGKRIQPRDLILLSTGHPQRPIAEAFPSHISVEAMVGYEGTWAPYRVFESNTWRQTVYGWESGLQHASAMNTQGKFFDETIYNFFDVDDFPRGDGSGDFLLFLGRIIPLKGIEIAVETSKRTGIPLVIAGPGTPPDYGEYVGVVGPERRAELMGAARAVMTPTLYLEPFGGACVESQLCGTPAITTPFGAYIETVEQGVSGFRCATLRDFCEAVEAAPFLNRDIIRMRAVRMFSTEAIGKQFESYFDRLASLWGEGWYAL